MCGIWGGKGKRVALIKRVKLTWEFEEACEGRALLKVGSSGPESVIWLRLDTSLSLGSAFCIKLLSQTIL